jgi:ABC-type transport system involved in cytochrome bd biosynthesis fused ATPase/permease subunit
MSAEVKALLAAAEEAEDRCKRYSRVADMLDRLTLALYIPAFVATAVGLAAHMFYGWWQIAAAGLALWIAGYAAYILRDVYGDKAAKSARQACVFRRTAEAAAEIDRVVAKLEKEVDELEQELKKRGIVGGQSAD